MTIKHLVIPGGGPSGIQTVGALYHLETNGFWKIEEIETIYATSVGTMIALLFSLKFDWETMNDYIIKRPWNDVFKVDIDQFFEAYKKKGLFGIEVFKLFYKPFFDAKDLSLDISMKDFHTFSGIELHFFTLEINEFKLVDLSHLTHPDLPILKAVQMSSAIPIFIAPVCVENECYVDGGFVCNYPLNQCIERVGNSDEILGLYDCDPELSSNGEVKESSTILDYTTIFINKVVNNVKLYVEPKEIPNQLSYIFEKMNFKSIQEAVNSREKRQQLFDSGVKAGKDYLDSLV